MKKFITKFNTHVSYEEATLDYPNVSLITEDDSVVYLMTAPPYSGFCKLTLNDGSVVEIEGEGKLTGNMTSPYKSTVVSAEIGTQCTRIVSAFSSCPELTSVTIGNSVTSIGNYTFQSSKALTSVTIGNSMASIGDSAFFGCSGLTSITIPNSVTSIGFSAFSGCSALTSVTVEATTPPSLGTNVFNNTNITTIYVPAESVSAYKTATNWSTYASRIQAIPS